MSFIVNLLLEIKARNFNHLKFVHQINGSFRLFQSFTPINQITSQRSMFLFLNLTAIDLISLNYFSSIQVFS